MIYATKIKTWGIGLLCAVLLSAGFAPVAQAQYVSAPSSNINSIDEFISYLYRLIAELETLKANQSYRYNPPIYSQSSYGTYLSGSFDVDTVGVRDTEDDETTMVGELRLGNRNYADVWFEFGEDDDMDEETRQVRMDRGNRPEFTARVRGLDEDERFYFRAVAEDDRGNREYGRTKMFQLDDYYHGRDRDDDDDRPDAETDDAEEIEDDEAELHGEVDMNDFENGLVFFVYGEDKDQVEDVKDEDEYADIDEDGEDLQKIIVDSNLDDDEDYWRRVTGLDDNTDYYFRICVEYQDEDDDERLECGDVEEFETD